MTKRLEPMLWLDSNRGVYIPRDWANSFSNLATINGVSETVLADLRKGPDDNDAYWEAWAEVCDHAVVRDDKGNAFNVYQDGDCWLIPEGMEWSDETGFYVWPDSDAEA